jgi:hypothetical protein
MTFNPKGKVREIKFKALMTINSNSNVVRIQMTSHICYHPINRFLHEYVEDFLSLSYSSHSIQLTETFMGFAAFKVKDGTQT